MKESEHRRKYYRGGRRKHRSLAKTIPLRKLMLRDHCTCYWCGGWVILEEASREHLIPFARGGGNGWSNIVLAHERCNNERSNSSDSDGSGW